MLKVFVDKPKKNEQILVALLWSNPLNYKLLKAHKITDKTFVDKANYIYFKIGSAMFDSGIKNFDKISILTYLDKRPEMKEEFELAGGYEVIDEMMKYLTNEDKSNVEYHANEIMKFQCLRDLYNKGFISKDSPKNVETLMKADIDELRLYLNHQINQSLAHVNSSNYEIYDLVDNSLYDVIEEARKGVQGAIPFYNAPKLTKITKGWVQGKLYYLAMPSGLGKSTMARNLFLPSIIENKQNSLIFVNEETLSSWKLNLLITVVNMKLDKEIVFKENILKGGFTEQEYSALKSAADWLIKNSGDFIIKIVLLKNYKFTDVVKILEEYRPYNISTVILDTFKPAVSAKGREMARWEEFGENAQELYDLIKEENMNVRCLATVQMKIGYNDTYLSLDGIGKSREIAEVADVAMLCREVFANELSGGMNEIPVYRWKKDKDNPDAKWEKERVELSSEKKYIVMFFGKNRFGTDNEQIVYEIDYKRNLVYEVGFTSIRRTNNYN